MPSGKVPGQTGLLMRPQAADATPASPLALHCSLLNDDSLHIVKDSLNILGKY